jgi:hypothetical protein
MIDNANVNNQAFVEVCKEAEYDLDIIDDMYLLLNKDYITDDDGNIEFMRIREIVRGDPLVMRMVAEEDGTLGGEMWTCLDHREQEHRKPGICDEQGCGKKLHEVLYIAVQGGSDNQPKERYIEGEVIHASKYFPSILYGFPPVISIWKEISILLHMNNYVNDYYQNMRTPRGAVMVYTNNIRQTFDEWDVIQERVGNNPAHVPIIPVQQMPDGNTQGKSEFIKFMDTLSEMQYIQAKDDLRQRISSLYGVTNILMNDPAGSGGLNDEGLQIKVTDRSVESGQSIWNDKIYPKVCKEFGITDYVLQLRPNEEEDEMEELQIDQLRIQNANAMHAMGFDVELDDDGKPTRFSGEAKDIEQMGGMSGLFGSQSQQSLPGIQTPHGLREFNRTAVPVAHNGGLVTAEAPVVVNKDELIVPLSDLEFSIKKDKDIKKYAYDPSEHGPLKTGPRGGKYFETGTGTKVYVGTVRDTTPKERYAEFGVDYEEARGQVTGKLSRRSEQVQQKYKEDIKHANVHDALGMMPRGYKKIPLKDVPPQLSEPILRKYKSEVPPRLQQDIRWRIGTENLEDVSANQLKAAIRDIHRETSTSVDYRYLKPKIVGAEKHSEYVDNVLSQIEDPDAANAMAKMLYEQGIEVREQEYPVSFNTSGKIYISEAAYNMSDKATQKYIAYGLGWLYLRNLSRKKDLSTPFVADKPYDRQGGIVDPYTYRILRKISDRHRDGTFFPRDEDRKRFPMYFANLFSHVVSGRKDEWKDTQAVKGMQALLRRGKLVQRKPEPRYKPGQHEFVEEWF